VDSVRGSDNAVAMAAGNEVGETITLSGTITETVSAWATFRYEPLYPRGPEGRLAALLPSAPPRPARPFGRLPVASLQPERP